MEGIPEVFYEGTPHKSIYTLQRPSRNGKRVGDLFNIAVPSEFYIYGRQLHYKESSSSKESLRAPATL